MASTSDRARYYLEQSVPELQELLRKEVFTKEELSSIVKKRSDFEHKINARGSDVSDYVRYVAYEQNVESLKKKRIQRMGVKNFDYSATRRTYFIFERATKKFSGDVRLWIQYLDYTRSQKAHKRMGKILTTVLRLHPTNSDLWIFAAKYAAHRGDSPSAGRSYMQRALRFCPKEKRLWLEYVGMEMQFISRITENIQQMGVNPTPDENDDDEEDELETDMIELPELEVQDGQQIALEPQETQALQKMASTPALSGDIPIAIFDSAMQEFNGDSTLAEQLFDVIATFHTLACSNRLLKHIVQYLNRQVPSTANAAICAFKLPLIGVDPTSSKFPLALRHALQLIRSAIVQQQNRQKRLSIAEKASYTILPLAINKEIDIEIRKVIGSVLSQIVKVLGNEENIIRVVNSLQTMKRLQEADRILTNSIKQFPLSKTLQKKYLELHPKSGG